MSQSFRRSSQSIKQIPVGTVIDRRFTIVRELGRGGMGIVCLAQDYQLQKYVALKLLLAMPSANNQHLQRMQREAKVLEQLEHPNLVGVLASNFQINPPYIALEYLQGRELKKMIRQEGESGNDFVKRQQRLTWCLEVAEAVAHCHAAGFVHRDIKPSNIIIREDNQQAVLIDFGLVGQDQSADSSETEKLGPTLTKSQHVIGTPHYMAPEQLDRSLGQIGPHSDVWALAATVFYVMTGHTPYTDDAQALFHAKRLTTPARSLSQLTTRFDRLEEIVDQALAIDIEARPSLAEFMSVLRAESEGQVLPAIKKQKQGRFRAILGIGLTLIVCVAAAIGFQMKTRADSELKQISTDLLALDQRTQLGQSINAEKLGAIQKQLKVFQPVPGLSSQRQTQQRLTFLANLNALEQGLLAGRESKADWSQLTQLEPIAARQSVGWRSRFSVLQAVLGQRLGKISGNKQLQLLKQAPKQYKDRPLVREALAKCYFELKQPQDCLAQLQYCSATLGCLKMRALCYMQLKQPSKIGAVIKLNPKLIPKLSEMQNYAWALFQREVTSPSYNPFSEYWIDIIREHGQFGIRQQARKLIETELDLLCKSKDYNTFRRQYDRYCWLFSWLRRLNAGMSADLSDRVFSFSLLFTQENALVIGPPKQTLDLYEDYAMLNPRSFKHWYASAYTIAFLTQKLSKKQVLDYCKFVFDGCKQITRYQERWAIYTHLASMLKRKSSESVLLTWNLKFTDGELRNNSDARQVLLDVARAQCRQYLMEVKQKDPPEDIELKRSRLKKLLNDVFRHSHLQFGTNNNYIPMLLFLRGRILLIAFAAEKIDEQKAWLELAFVNLRVGDIPTADFSGFFEPLLPVITRPQIERLIYEFNRLRPDKKTITASETRHFDELLCFMRMLRAMLQMNADEAAKELKLLKSLQTTKSKKLKSKTKKVFSRLETLFKSSNENSKFQLRQLDGHLSPQDVAALLKND